MKRWIHSSSSLADMKYFNTISGLISQSKLSEVVDSVKPYDAAYPDCPV